MMRNVLETALAAMVLLVAGVFLAFASNIGNVAPVKGYEVIAKFNSIDGLARGNDVRIGGVKVGTVTDLTIDQKDYRAVVKMEVLPEEENTPERATNKNKSKCDVHKEIRQMIRANRNLKNKMPEIWTP